MLQLCWITELHITQINACYLFTYQLTTHFSSIIITRKLEIFTTSKGKSAESFKISDYNSKMKINDVRNLKYFT
jgi:hypothetical protein